MKTNLLLETLPGPWTCITVDGNKYRGRYEVNYSNLEDTNPVILHIQHLYFFRWRTLGAPSLTYIPAIRVPSSETVRRHVRHLHPPELRDHYDDVRFRCTLILYFCIAFFLLFLCLHFVTHP